MAFRPLRDFKQFKEMGIRENKIENVEQVKEQLYRFTNSQWLPFKVGFLNKQYRCFPLHYTYCCIQTKL